MASKRAVLETLKVKDLIFVADKFDIQLENRRKKDDVVASIAKTRKVAIGELLQALPLATLKASCASLDIEAKGRSKAGFVEALTGPAKKKAAAKPKAEKVPAKKKAAAKPKVEKAPVKKKKQPLINKAPVEAPKKEADPEPRQAVLDKVASIKPAETSQPDYSQIKKEYVGLEIQKVDCPSCATEVKLANCQAHQCSNRFVFQQRKICASCWYERSSVSIGEYLDEDKIDTRCAACSAEIDVESFADLKSA